LHKQRKVTRSEGAKAFAFAFAFSIAAAFNSKSNARAAEQAPLYKVATPATTSMDPRMISDYQPSGCCEALRPLKGAFAGMTVERWRGSRWVPAYAGTTRDGSRQRDGSRESNGAAKSDASTSFATKCVDPNADSLRHPHPPPRPPILIPTPHAPPHAALQLAKIVIGSNVYSM
jgi:hypothetical protein